MLSFKHIATYLVLAGAIKAWSPGEDIETSDLNANFNHIHSKMVGGHGARLVDADVASNAAISLSKIQAGSTRIARAAAGEVLQAGRAAKCTSGTCDMGASVNVTSVVRTSAGLYTITLGYTATDATYNVICTMSNSKAIVGITLEICEVVALTQTQIQVKLWDIISVPGTPALADAPFSFIVYDDN